MLDPSTQAFNMDLLSVNPAFNKNKRAFVVDNFYKDPYAVREFALQQEFFDDPGYVGRRTRKQFDIPGTKEAFEDIVGAKVTGWNETYGMNARFQHNWAGERLVYHCDDQMWGGMIYLTPDAPVCTGTSTWQHRETKRHHNSDIDWAAGEGKRHFATEHPTTR